MSNACSFRSGSAFIFHPSQRGYLAEICIETCNQQFGQHWNRLFEDCDQTRSDYGQFVGVCGEE